MLIKLFGKNLIANYTHYIMRLDFNGYHSLCAIEGLELRNVTNDFVNVFGKHQISTISISNLRKTVENNNGLTEVYALFNIDKNEPIGSVCLMYKGGNDLEYQIRNIDAYVYDVFIKEDCRGKGYVGAMIYGIVQILRDKSIPNVYLAVSINNTSAVKAYKKIGFKVVDSRSFWRILKINIPYHQL